MVEALCGADRRSEARRLWAVYLGVDIGGTFTDLVLMDDGGYITVTKALSTPGDLQRGVFDAIERAATLRKLTVEELLVRIRAFGHGTTQATNALIERDGARTGLITTRGFGDTLLLQRLMGFTAGVPMDRLGRYSQRRHPQPIVPRTLIREVAERVDQAGHVLLKLDEDDVRRAAHDFIALGVETVAVCLLWSFRYPEHEKRVAEILAEMMPDAYLSLSSVVAPVIGEYERTATTALNSYLAPKVVCYLREMENSLSQRGFSGNFSILNSAGGVMPAVEAAERPVVLITSGPTGGVLGSLRLARELGYSNVITSDMGGTSFDVGLIVDGRPLLSTTHEAGGFHITTPMVQISAIGAGGGSIAYIDGGQLRVGPESAGANPGPACYGGGGVLPTVTDADVVLGIINQNGFLGGKMALDRRAAAEAIRVHIAEPLGMSTEQAAGGIRRIVDAHMADTLREVTIGRGLDPRDFVLFAYGGAGPIHCAGFGAELGVSQIVVPTTCIAHSAYGALVSDVNHAVERSLLMRGGGGGRRLYEGLDAKMLEVAFFELEVACTSAMRRAGIEEADVSMSRAVSMRYRRQSNDLAITMPAGEVTLETVARLTDRFERTYEGRYGLGSGFSGAGVEITNLRAEAVGKTRRPSLRRLTTAKCLASSIRPIFDPPLNSWIDAVQYHWDDIPLGFMISGPAVVERQEAAVFVGAGQVAQVDQGGNIVVRLPQPSAREF
jgi:N-methylhydantoinase A